MRNVFAKYDVDELFFTNINTEYQAYWYGFLLADGCLLKTHSNKPQRCISVALSIKDTTHLETFKAAIKSEHPIKTYKDAVYIRIHSQVLVNSLNMNGFDKFRKFGRWPSISSELEHHFVRGLFDGDGWISRSHNHNGTYRPEIGLCCTHKKPLYEAARVLKINPNILVAKSNKSITPIWKWRKQGSQCADIYKILYNNASVFLGRKRTYLESML